MRGRRLLRGRGRYSALVIAPLLVLGTLSVGPRIGPFGLLSPLPEADPLDYESRPGSGFAPLSARFVSSVLGGGVGSEGGASRATGGRPGALAAAAPGATATRLTDVHPLTNDDIADARFVPSVPFTAKTNTRNATRESGEATACSPVGSSTVWYRYTPTSNIRLLANTFGSNYATALGVFKGKPGSLAQVGCDTDASGNAIVAFGAKKDATYYFQIVGPAGGGDLVFNLDPQGVTKVVSVADGKRIAFSGEPTISGDGQFIAFSGQGGVHVRDLTRSTTTLVSLDSSGRPANDVSSWPFISYDGRYVAFESSATNLVRGDNNGTTDVFVHDLVARTTRRVSVTSAGKEARGTSDDLRGFYQPSISADGNAVAFSTDAALVPDDRNDDFDVYVNDRLTGRTERVSVSSSGAERGPEEPLNGCCWPKTHPDQLAATISPNGRYVRFSTSSSNLVPNDTNGLFDAFVHDRLTHRTERVTFTLSGEQTPALGERADGEITSTAGEFAPRQGFSYDGRFVVYSRENGKPPYTASGLKFDIMVFDRKTKRTSIASLSSSGARAEDGADCRGASISADGRYVAFHSDASNLVPGDTNGMTDVFIRDLHTRTTVRVSVTPTAESTDAKAVFANLSGEGRHVAYASVFAYERPSYTFFVSDEASSVYVLDRGRSTG